MQDHGERLATVETLVTATREDVQGLRSDVHSILARLETISAAAVKAMEAIHTPLSCPNSPRITTLEHRADRADGGWRVIVWIMGGALAIVVGWATRGCVGLERVLGLPKP